MREGDYVVYFAHPVSSYATKKKMKDSFDYSLGRIEAINPDDANDIVVKLMSDYKEESVMYTNMRTDPSHLLPLYASIKETIEKYWKEKDAV